MVHDTVEFPQNKALQFRVTKLVQASRNLIPVEQLQIAPPFHLHRINYTFRPRTKDMHY